MNKKYILLKNMQTPAGDKFSSGEIFRLIRVKSGIVTLTRVSDKSMAEIPTIAFGGFFAEL